MNTLTSTFRDVALRSFARGENRILPIAIGAKKPLLEWKGTELDVLSTEDWAAKADAWLDQLSAAFPEANVAVIAKPTEFLFIDEDKVDEFRKGYEAFAGEPFPRTFTTSSRPDHNQSHWLQADATRSLGNVRQDQIVGGILSIRQNNLYVLAEGSKYKDNINEYKVVDDSPIIPMPDKLVEYLQTIRVKKIQSVSSDGPRTANNRVPHGSIHGYMLTKAGQLRNTGLSVEGIESALLELVHANCEPPIDDSKVRALARSMGSYAPGESGELALTQTAEPVERPTFAVQKWPQFPEWALAGTSLYDNFVQPICAVNSRVPYFLWYPAMVMMMNFLGTKVTVWGKDLHTNLYLILVGRKGKLKKSSSVQDSMRYLEYAGVLGHCTRDTKMASGKSIIWTAGSIESVGIGMERTATKNAILFYDEFGSLAAKAGIEGSNLSNQLLTTYESNKFANSVKSAKESFSHEPGSYAFSLIACNTRNDFAEKWAKFAKGASGMEERFAFVLQPEKLPPSTPFTYVSTQEGATRTRQMIDKALEKRTYHIYDPKPFADVLNDPNDPWSDREEIRAEKYALFFAIDLGLDDIDEECVARALAVVQYEREVKEFLKPVTANNAIAAGQISVRLLLERNGGEMSLRDLLKQLNAHRHGTGNWYVIYDGLIKAGIIQQVGTGKKGDPEVVQVLEKMPADDDD